MPEVGISTSDLPESFNWPEYYRLKRTSKKQLIEYVKTTIPKDKIILYQNRLAQELSASYSINSKQYKGFCGPDRNPAGIIVEKYGYNHYTVNTVDYSGTHLSTFRTDERGIQKLKDRNFWVFPGRSGE